MKTQTTHSPYVLDSNGFWRFKTHPGQRRVLESQKRFVLMLAGTQSGKTVLGSWWLLKEIARRGRGDYIVATPTYPLMSKKVLPEFLRLFRNRLQLGNYHKADRIFELSARGQEILFGDIQPEEPTQIFFGHAQDPDSLESATAKAAWLDEAGQRKFRMGSWEALQRRLSIHEGRVLITSTPYTLGWLKNDLHDPALAGDPDVDLIQFDSTQNPYFPLAEYERMQAKMPRWKFNMMYRGIFERPAGMIYDCFDADHKTKRFTIPADWPRYVGVDFGGVNTAAVFIAEDPQTRNLYLYRTYHAGSRTAREHVLEMRKDEPAKLVTFGGAGSEGQWRMEFKTAGLHINQPPVSEVEVGIDRVYAIFKSRRLFVFDDLSDVIDDLESYSRVLDDQGEPTEAIEDKNTYHRLDALRYIASFLNNTTPTVRRVVTY